MDIVTLGEALIDMFPAETGRRLVEVTAFHPAPGGAPANVAVAAARLGAEAAFIGKVGDDIFGHHLADVLAAEGVGTAGVRFDDEARTTMAIVGKPDENTAEFVFYRNPGADQRLRPEELDLPLLQSTRALHIGSLSLTDEPARSATYRAVEIAADGGALVSYDVNYRPSLWKNPADALTQARAMLPRVDLLKVNAEELALLAGEDGAPERARIEPLARALLAEGPSAVIVTLGAGGSAFCTAEGSGFVDAFAVETVDAVGCGDSVIAALLVRLLSEHGDWRTGLALDALRVALRTASATAALTATRQGVIPALPTTEEVRAFLAQREDTP